MKRTCLVGVLLLLCGCRIGPVDPQPQEYTTLEDKAFKQPVARPAPATVTPQEAFEAFRAAIADGDYDAVWPLLSKDTQDSFENQAAEFEMQLRNRPDTPRGARDLLNAMGLKAEDVRSSERRVVTGMHWLVAMLRIQARKDPEHFKRIARSRFARAEVAGNRARVFVVIDGTIQDQPMGVNREGTLWKIELGQ